MSGVIDTNLLLYAVNSDAPEHRAAKNFLDSALSAPGAWYLSDGIVYEFLRVATHHKIFPKPLGWAEALSFLQPIVQCENVHFLQSGNNHWTILGRVLAELTRPAGNIFFDIRTAVLMRETGVREIYTFDTDFLQFSGITVINPLKAESG